MITDIDAIESVCKKLKQKKPEDAKKIIIKNLKFKPLDNAGRGYTEVEKTKVFLRDGFIDRYSGKKLVYQPVLRILSKEYPEIFPFHKNWKMSECHIAYWELVPTIDHKKPVSRGGEDEYKNWITTSQLGNSAKSNWTLEELGWKLKASGNLKNWDGMLVWFMEYVKENKMQKVSYIKNWYNAALEYYKDKVLYKP
jgi:5-methylcytosine-specific restriction endonuclease McrA